MAVERKEDGSITIRDESGMVTVGKIGAVFTPDVNPKQEAKREAWVEKCAQIINPQPHTISEVEEYFLQQCEAIPLNSEDSRMRNFYINVVMNCCLKDRKKLDQVSLEMSNEEFEGWHRRQKELSKEVSNSSPEDYGLIMKGYYLPKTLRNQQIYEEKDPGWEELPEEHRIKHIEDNEEICFYFEETTGYISLNGSGIGLYNRLIAYKGITREDINLRNSNFKMYICIMHDLGYLTMGD